MSIKIVSDSSSNVFSLEGIHYTTVPMKVITSEKEYIDTPALDLLGMVRDLQSYKGKSGSSCPNVQEWLDAFEGDDDLFALTISGGLSGSYNSATQAAAEFEQTHPGRRAYVIDTKSAGPQQIMLAVKLKELILAGYDFDTIVKKIREYQNHTHILFCLESMNNLARNGRISPLAAKFAGMLGIRACGDVQNGQITPVHKPRGAKKATQVLTDMIIERGFADGNILRIAHCFGENQAKALGDAVMEKFPNTRLIIEPTTALCSFYAEEGGLMIGFEGGYNAGNNCNM